MKIQIHHMEKENKQQVQIWKSMGRMITDNY